MSDRSAAAAAPVCDSEALSPRLMAAPAAIAGFCKRWRVAELSLFGSVLRDDYNRKSDIDVLVEFEPHGAPGLDFFRMAAELSSILGRPVDMLTRPAVERSQNHIRRQEILESAEIIYAARCSDS